MTTLDHILECAKVLEAQSVPKPWYVCVHCDVLRKQFGWTDEQIEKYQKDHADIQRGAEGDILIVRAT